VWDSINTHVWTTSGKNVSDSSWHVARFSDVSSKETSLRKTDDIELTLEVLIGSNLLAGLLSNVLEVVDNLTNRWEADLDAMDWGIKTFTNEFIDLSDSWVEAHISESVEHGSWDTLSLITIPLVGSDSLNIIEGRSFSSIILRSEWVESTKTHLIGKLVDDSLHEFSLG